MSFQATNRILAIVALSLLGGAAGAQQIYCYNDENGKRHCGDSIPPAAARRDRDVLNNQGVVVRQEQGEITEDERAAMAAEQLAREERQREAEERARYGQMLLDSFASVESIEALRDRIVAQIEDQIGVIELSLSNLHKQLDALHNTATRYAPLNQSENARPLPPNVTQEIERTEASIAMFEERLRESIADREATRESFDKDIAFFIELNDGV